LVKLSASPTARKFRRRRSSIVGFHYAENAWQRNRHGIGRLGKSGSNCPHAQNSHHHRKVQMATVRNQVLLSMFTDFENFSVFKPASNHEKSVNAMFDQVIAWGGALKALREK
jgi:hypothetical protein